MSDDAGLKHLLSLLDDESEEVAIPVLAALLERHIDLLPYLAELQESRNPAVRRRVHQLQSILTIRERRYELLQKIENQQQSFSENLLELHMQWFDCDMQGEVFKVYEEFASSFGESGVSTLAEAAQYMLKTGFFAVRDTALDPEIYCIGSALSSRKMAESLLCGMIADMLDSQDIRVVYANGSFVLTDGKVTVIPSGLWQIEEDKVPDGRTFDKKMLLKFAVSMLFSYSVSQDHFRYIYTIGQALTGCRDDSFLDHLPYPYCRLPETYSSKRQGGNL